MIDKFINEVCIMFGVKPEHLYLTRKIKPRELVTIRQIIFYFLRKYTKLSHKSIGAIYDKDHATSIHSVNVIHDLLKTDKMVQFYCNKIEPIAFDMLHDKNIIERFTIYQVYEMMKQTFNDDQIEQFKTVYNEQLYEQCSTH
jgi:hypothetical protein